MGFCCLYELDHWVQRFLCGVATLATIHRRGLARFGAVWQPAGAGALKLANPVQKP